MHLFPPPHLIWCRKPILTLPPIDTATVTVTLSPPERDFYNSLLDRSQSVFDGFLKSGTASKSWFAIFSLLQRLRQACDHIALTVMSRIDGEIGKAYNGKESGKALTISGSETGSKVRAPGSKSISENVRCASSTNRYQSSNMLNLYINFTDLSTL